MEKKIEKFIPLLFQKVQEYKTNDTRFTQVKIWLMHLQENLNGSYFSKEAVIDAIPTLANTPILAFIEENSDGEIDFSDHRMVLVKKDGECSIKYLGQAIGVIPSDNNARFEMRLCDDGVEREFLVCDGLIWNKWDEPIDIFNRDVVKWQSMELHDDYEGFWGEDGLFHFTKFKFFGACALGKDVLPAMHNAIIEAQFSYKDIFKDIQEKMEQFKVFTQEGGQVMEDVKQTDVAEEVETVGATEEIVEQEFENTVSTEKTVETSEATETVDVETKEDTVEIDYKAKYEKIKLDYEQLQEKLAKFESELEELRQFKSTKLAEERAKAEQELYERFSAELTEEEIAEVKAVASKYTLEQLEEKLFTLVGKKKANFAKQTKKEKQSIKIDLEIETKEKTSRYGDLFERFDVK